MLINLQWTVIIECVLSETDEECNHKKQSSELPLWFARGAGGGWGLGAGFGGVKYKELSSVLWGWLVV